MRVMERDIKTMSATTKHHIIVVCARNVCNNAEAYVVLIKTKDNDAMIRRIAIGLPDLMLKRCLKSC